jgi:hypothetical protein
VTTILAALVSALFTGGLVGILQSRAQNRRTTAEAEKVAAEAEVTISGAWQLLYTEQRKEINELRERLVIVEKSEEACQRRLAQLESHATPEKIEAKVSSLIDAKIAAHVEERAS